MSAFDRLIDWLERRLNLSEILSWVTTFGISYAKVNPNQPVRDAAKEAFLTPLPSYQRWPHIFGVLTFVNFVVEVVTGLLLAFYYEPSVENAYQSSRLIIRDATFGWYIFQMHYWGAQVLVALLFVRLVRFVIDRVYAPPRELIWIFGVVLFFLAVQSSITGQVLTWDQQGYWGTIRSLDLLRQIPIFGSFLDYLLGGFVLSASLLTRFYLLHIIFLPTATFLFFYLHFATVRRVGLSTVSYVDENARPIYPFHVINLVIILIAIFGGLLTLAVLLPSPFGVEANRFQTPTGIRISWFLLPLYGLFELLPSIVARVIALVAFVAVFLVPFIDRRAEVPLRKRPLLIGVWAVAFVVIIILSILGYRHRG